MCGLQFDCKPLESGAGHGLRDDVLGAAGDDVEHPLADIVLPDDEEDFADDEGDFADRDAEGLSGGLCFPPLPVMCYGKRIAAASS